MQNKFEPTFLDRWLVEADLRRYLDSWDHNQLNVAERILFGQKTDAGMVNTRRHIQNLYEVNPTARVESVALFGRALAGRGLFEQQISEVAGDRFRLSDMDGDRKSGESSGGKETSGNGTAGIALGGAAHNFDAPTTENAPAEMGFGWPFRSQNNRRKNCKGCSSKSNPTGNRLSN